MRCRIDTFLTNSRLIFGRKFVWVAVLIVGDHKLVAQMGGYKHPGGGGFAPHQDAVAYRFVDHHISVMVPLDSATEESGCLFVASGYENGKLPTDDRERYYANKRQVFADSGGDFNGERVRISISDDFLGRPVS